jgi:hypothetical protein
VATLEHDHERFRSRRRPQDRHADGVVRHGEERRQIAAQVVRRARLRLPARARRRRGFFFLFVVSQRWLYVELTGLQREQAGTRDCNEPERFENVETEGGGIFENGSHQFAPLADSGCTTKRRRAAHANGFVLVAQTCRLQSLTRNAFGKTNEPPFEANESVTTSHLSVSHHE